MLNFVCPVSSFINCWAAFVCISQWIIIFSFLFLHIYARTEEGYRSRGKTMYDLKLVTFVVYWSHELDLHGRWVVKAIVRLKVRLCALRLCLSFENSHGLTPSKPCRHARSVCLNPASLYHSLFIRVYYFIAYRLIPVVFVSTATSIRNCFQRTSTTSSVFTSFDKLFTYIMFKTIWYVVYGNHRWFKPVFH